MKAIIQAYTPEEMKRIARGEQTIKVCKTALKDTPFKVYMYKKPYAGGAKIINEVLNGVYGGGKVVGEFVCDSTTRYNCDKDYDEYFVAGYIGAYMPFKEMCLTNKNLIEYGKGDALYGWHISELKIYDEPKELGEFRQACKIFSKRVCGLKALCGEQKGICDGTKKLTHAPRGWQYVEELSNGETNKH